MIRRLGFTKLIFVLAVLACSNPALAGGGILSTEETFKRMQGNRLTLIDVRSPQEWRETGVAKPGQRYVITAGAPFGVRGTTNMIRVEHVRE